MDSLPTEILLVIIDSITHDQASLASCARLSKRWHGLARCPLYKEPKLHRLPALEAFLRTVDTSEMAQYLQRNGSCIYSPAPSVSGPELGGSEWSGAARATSEYTSIIPAGVFVEAIDLSMLPHRWETVHFGLIQSLARGCPFVSTLNLSHCVLLRDTAVQVIAEQLGPRQLRSLVLSGCNKITDLAVLSLCVHTVRLENLELSGCDRITDVSILELASTITARDVPECSPASDQRSPNDNICTERHIDEQGSAQVFSRSIKSLDLSFCTKITDIGIRGLRMGTSQLISLNLEGCYGVLTSDEELGVNEWEDFDGVDADDESM